MPAWAIRGYGSCLTVWINAKNVRYTGIYVFTVTSLLSTSQHHFYDWEIMFIFKPKWKYLIDCSYDG